MKRALIAMAIVAAIAGPILALAFYGFDKTLEAVNARESARSTACEVARLAVTRRIGVRLQDTACTQTTDRADGHEVIVRVHGDALARLGHRRADGSFIVTVRAGVVVAMRP